jgi:hypothetical protein
MKNPAQWRAKRYHDAFRMHWGVFVDGHLVDSSFDERDVELRSCSLCECRDLHVIVREAEPYTTYAGVKRWQVNNLRITPRVRDA